MIEFIKVETMEIHAHTILHYLSRHAVNTTALFKWKKTPLDTLTQIYHKFIKT